MAKTFINLALVNFYRVNMTSNSFLKTVTKFKFISDKVVVVLVKLDIKKHPTVF